MAVCAIKYTERGDERNIAQIIPVAGTYPSSGIEAATSLLGSASDPAGVRVELHGQMYLDQRQSAIIELTCDNTVDVRPRFRPFLFWGVSNFRSEKSTFGRLMRVFYDLTGGRNMRVQQPLKIPLKKMIRTVVRIPNTGVSSPG
jgi:Autophagy-related protein 27